MRGDGAQCESGGHINPLWLHWFIFQGLPWVQFPLQVAEDGLVTDKNPQLGLILF